MKKDSLSNHFIFGIILFFSTCSSNPGEIIENSEFAMKECQESEIAIALDSIIFRNLKPINKNISHRDITLEIVLNIHNNTNEVVAFDIDHEDYAYFNFKGLVSNSVLNDTIDFNSFKNPIFVEINEKSSTNIKLGSYNFPFEKFMGEGSYKKSVSQILKSFTMVYKPKNGKSICISQDRNVIVYVKD